MATTNYLNTPTSNYALGRNTVLTLTFPDYSNSFSSVSMEICISQGQVSMETDTIEINSNCQSGWKVKLPGLVSGTVTGTGYIASSNVTSAGTNPSVQGDPMDLLQFLGYVGAVQINAVSHYINGGSATSDDPFEIAPTVANPYNGFFKSANVSISPDDAVKLDFTIELSGAQNILGFVAIAQGLSQ